MACTPCIEISVATVEITNRIKSDQAVDPWLFTRHCVVDNCLLECKLHCVFKPLKLCDHDAAQHGIAQQPQHHSVVNFLSANGSSSGTEGPPDDHSISTTPSHQRATQQETPAPFLPPGLDQVDRHMHPTGPGQTSYCQ